MKLVTRLANPTLRKVLLLKVMIFSHLVTIVLQVIRINFKRGMEQKVRVHFCKEVTRPKGNTNSDRRLRTRALSMRLNKIIAVHRLNLWVQYRVNFQGNTSVHQRSKLLLRK